MLNRRIKVELLSRAVLATFAVWLFSAAYIRQPPTNIIAMGYFPVAMLVPLIVADFALFVLIMIARISQPALDFALLRLCWHRLHDRNLSDQQRSRRRLVGSVLRTFDRLDHCGGSKPYRDKRLVVPYKPNATSKIKPPMLVALQRRTMGCNGGVDLPLGDVYSSARPR